MLNLNLNITSSPRGPVGPAPTPVPVVDFSASATGATAGDTINFTDLSTNSPTSWQWSFPGGTPTGSTGQNPSVTYSATGSFNVSLSAGNTGGTGSLTKTNYITISAPACPANLISTTNLQGYYKFNSGALTTDSSGNGFTLTNTGVTETTGKFAGGADFNGGEWFAVSTGNFAPSVNWTLSLWFNTTNSANQSLFDKRLPGTDGSRILLRPTNDFLVSYHPNNYSFSLPASVDDGAWHNVIVTKTSGNVTEVFLDGSSLGTASTVAYTSTVQQLNIGRDRAGASSYFDGIMDEYIIYDRVLTSTEIADISAGTCPLKS